MGEEAAEAEGVRHSSAIDRLPRDLLHRLDGNRCSFEQPDVPGGNSDELELNLGLSLGGCFGMDPKGKMLVRSSSIASFSVPAEHDFPTVAPTIARASSLPTESEQERRKRKELQSLKRFEVKRKRLEKRNSIRPGAARSDEDADVGRSWRAAVLMDGFLEPQIGSQLRGVFKADSSPTPPDWSVGTKSSAAPPADAPGSFLSIPRGSLGGNGGSFGKFEFQRQMLAKEFDTSLCCSKRDAKRTTKVISVDEATNTVPEVRKPNTAVREEDSLKKVTPNVTNLGRSIMGEMPFVSTTGDGPNGRRVEGFLYKYRKGEEVRIVCVCHGSFLTPAEFVKHAGGGDVAHPLRHIVVNPCPSALL